MPKVILDTNIFLAAIIFGGMSVKIIELILDEKLTLVMSQELKDEVIFKLATKFKADEAMINDFNSLVDSTSFWYEPKTEILECRDPKDNFLLELAFESDAEFLITRDKDLLEINNGNWQNTRILTPEIFLNEQRNI